MVQPTLFEDEASLRLRPLTTLLPVQLLVYGSKRIFSKHEEALGEKTFWLVREEVKERVSEDRRPTDDEPLLLINARVIPEPNLYKRIKSLPLGKALVQGKTLIAALVSPKELEAVMSGQWASKLQVERVEGLPLVENLWDLSPLSLIKELRRDIPKCDWKDVGLQIVGDRGNACISEDIQVIGPSVVDAREGPVYIGPKVTIEPFSYLKGPLYIEEGALIVSGARIGGSYIGRAVRAGGEISTSIIMEYSNKYHFGFLGHSYVGRWVNIGAGMITSNLKNTYGNVKVRGTDTGLNKVGAFIGDHSKLSIGSKTYAGVSLGIAAHLHGTAFEDVPPFTIYAKTLGVGMYELEIDSVIRTYRRMCPRRGVEPDPIEELLLERAFYATEDERRRAGVIKGRFRLK